MLQPKLTKVEPVKPLKLCLYYETGEVKLFDAAPYATGSWYGRLQDESYFATVHLLPGGIGIEWEEGQDIAPHELYENSVPVKKTAYPNAKGRCTVHMQRPFHLMGSIQRRFTGCRSQGSPDPQRPSSARRRRPRRSG